MTKPVRVALVTLGVVGAAAVAARRAGMIGGGPQVVTGPTVSLPLLCRLRGHGWRMPKNNTQTPTRRTCQKCQTIDVPMP